jgi:hypothetical protein
MQEVKFAELHSKVDYLRRDQGRVLSIDEFRDTLLGYARVEEVESGNQWLRSEMDKLQKELKVHSDDKFLSLKKTVNELSQKFVAD